MKILKNQNGFIILTVTFFIALLSFHIVIAMFDNSFSEYKTVRQEADYTKARFLAQGGLQLAIMALTRIPKSFRYKFRLLLAPPPLSLPFVKDSVVTYSMADETGKINLNQMLRFDGSDEPNIAVRGMLDRLSENLKLSSDMWDVVLDWIDENDVREPRGAESAYYNSLEPPRKIKNNRLHSLNELLLLPGFSREVLFDDLRTEEQKEEFSDDFLSEEEGIIIEEDDYRLINNITVNLPADAQSRNKYINISTAPYHVILSLSEFMTPALAKEILITRLKNGDRLTFATLSAIPEMNQKLSEGTTLLQEIQNYITYDDSLYKIVAVASFKSQTARVVGMYDVNRQKLTFYAE